MKKQYTLSSLALILATCSGTYAYGTQSGVPVDGVGYNLNDDEYWGGQKENFPQIGWKCDMLQSAAERIVIDRSGIPAESLNLKEGSILDWFYWGGIKYFATHGTLQDGTKVSYVIAVSGEDKGKARLAGDGSGKIIDEMFSLE